MKAAINRVAVVVPLSDRPTLTRDEEVSMRHLSHFLGRYDKYLVAPRGTAPAHDGFRVVSLPRKFFGSAAAHNHLLMWPRFYRRFKKYEYILIYHLDSLVLSDDLARWCDAGWDYIGAPWLPCVDTPWVEQPHVGNGGFTLMRVASVLQVLHNRHRQMPITYWADIATRNGRYLRPVFKTLEWLADYFPKSTVLARCVRVWQASENPAEHAYNNDMFWSFQAVRYLSTFKVATVDEGLQFAFEASPRKCFELNGRQLPFGCHAWTKFDRQFWQPHLLPAD